jgi:alkyl hydroperoxide reductase subunit AhpC
MKFVSQIISFAVLALMHNSSAVEAYPMPRQMAPQFSDLNAVDANMDFIKLSLSDFKDKYVVLVFYPFDFTYVCPTELISFSENVAKFKELGAEVIGISTDSHFTHLAWLKQNRSEGGLG